MTSLVTSIWIGFGLAFLLGILFTLGIQSAKKFFEGLFYVK